MRREQRIGEILPSQLQARDFLGICGLALDCLGEGLADRCLSRLRTLGCHNTHRRSDSHSSPILLSLVLTGCLIRQRAQIYQCWNGLGVARQLQPRPYLGLCGWPALPLRPFQQKKHYPAFRANTSPFLVFYRKFTSCLILRTFSLPRACNEIDNLIRLTLSYLYRGSIKESEPKIKMSLSNKDHNVVISNEERFWNIDFVIES